MKVRRSLLSLWVAAAFLAVDVLSAGEKGESGNFRAELVIFSDAISERPDSIRRATMGEEVDIHVSFENPSLDAEGMSGVLMDAIIRRPDGSIACECRNMSGWVKAKPAPQGEPISADGYLKLKPEGEDPPGRYTVEIRVKDIPAKKSIDLTAVIEFVEVAKK